MPFRGPLTFSFFPFLSPLWSRTRKQRAARTHHVLKLCSITKCAFISSVNSGSEIPVRGYRSIDREVYKLPKSRQQWSRPKRFLNYLAQFRRQKAPPPQNLLYRKTDVVFEIHHHFEAPRATGNCITTTTITAPRIPEGPHSSRSWRFTSK